MATDIPSLFGITPQAYNQQQQQLINAEAQQFAQLDPYQQVTAGSYGAGRQLGRGIVGALGGEDPQLKIISLRNQIGKSINPNDPESIFGAAQQLMQAGDQQGGMLLAQEARRVNEEKTTSGLATAKIQQIQLSLAQEQKLRDELSKLGPNPTNDQVLNIVSQYGSPDKVLAVLQSSADRAAQRENSMQIAKERLDTQVQLAKERGATQMQIAQMMMEGRKELAILAASLKGPSSAELKAEEKANKIAEGKAGLGDTLEVARTLVKDLEEKGGMTSTAKTPLANLVTSLGTGTVGQMGGRMFGTETQAKRDELKSVRLQLLNAVKEATGMSATQLNSNVELKTWLDSLGGESMTKEANLAILNNISNRYLKGTANAPSNPSAGNLGTSSNPIVLK